MMLDALGDGSDLSRVQELKDARGCTSEFLLPRDMTITLIAGYTTR